MSYCFSSNSAEERILEDESRFMANVGRPLSALFELTAREGIRLSVLRNYEQLPDKPGRDIDIFVEFDKQNRVAEIARNCFLECGWSIISDWARSSVRSVSMIHRAGDRLAGFTVDFLAEVRWRSIEIVRPETIWSCTVSVPASFSHVTPGADAALRFHKILLRGEAYTLTKADFLRIAAMGDPSGFQTILADLLTSDEIAKIIVAIKSDLCSRDNLQTFAGIRRRLMFDSLRKAPLISLRWARSIVMLNFAPQDRRGLVLAFIGPDGSGKSAVIRRVCTVLANHGPRRTHLYYGRVPIFPRLVTLRNCLCSKPVDTPDFSSKHSGSNVKAHSLPRILVYFLYYGLEGMIARMVLWGRRIRGDVVLFDRYAYDFAAQPAYVKVPKSWLQLLYAVLPKPDIVCLLTCAPEVIYSRKPELTIKDIKKQQTRLCDLTKEFGGRPEVFELDTSSWEQDDFVHLLERVAKNWSGNQPAARVKSLA